MSAALDSTDWQDKVKAALSRQKIMRRMASMTIAWLLLGAVMGLQIGWRLHGGLLPIVSHVIAGMVVFSLIGVALSLFANRAEESIVGGLCGLLVGIVATAWQTSGEPGYTINLCMVAGGLIGATGWPWVYIIVKIISWRQAR